MRCCYWTSTEWTSDGASERVGEVEVDGALQAADASRRARRMRRRKSQHAVKDGVVKATRQIDDVRQRATMATQRAEWRLASAHSRRDQRTGSIEAAVRERCVEVVHCRYVVYVLLAPGLPTRGECDGCTASVGCAVEGRMLARTTSGTTVEPGSVVLAVLPCLCR